MLTARLGLASFCLQAMIPRAGNLQATWTLELSPEEARGTLTFREAVARHCLPAGIWETELAEVVNDSGLERPYVNPALLKNARRGLEDRLTAELDAWHTGLVQAVQQAPAGLPVLAVKTARSVAVLPARSEMRDTRTGLPFLVDPWQAQAGDFLQAGGCRWVPLCPVIPDQDWYAHGLADLVQRAQAGGERLCLGIANPGHLSMVKTSQCKSFIDYPLWTANTQALAFWQEQIDELEAWVPWIETDRPDELDISLPQIDRGSKLAFPLFISLVCPSSGAGCSVKSPDCRSCSSTEMVLRQNNRRFLQRRVAMGKDLLFLLFQIE